jgi:hypothetical protein
MHPTPPKRAVQPSWFDVVELIDFMARRDDNYVLYVLARQMGDLVDDHYNGDQGCDFGTEEYCPRWDDAQQLMLGWLLDRAVR